jgi:cystathionine beta-lyase/cystathionine gamma-synthase
MDDRRFETREVHSHERRDQYGAVMPPIYANSTYEYASPTETKPGGYRYSRDAVPTRDALEESFAMFEGGAYASAFSSGMGAIDAVFTATLDAGDHVVAAENLYAETHDLLTDVYRDYDVDLTHVPITDTDAIADAMTEDTALVYFESPTNPMLNVGDIAAAAEIAHDHGALLAIDNTFASPYLQRPLDLGADLVAESLTKYHCGHSDAIAGAVATNDPDLADEIAYVQYRRGAIPSPFDCFLVLRGMKTLSARMERHCANAHAVVDALQANEHVSEVYYPGLAEHTNHDVAADQMADFGAMVSFELAGDVDTVTEFAAGLEIFTLAESLGGVESLAEVPATMTHQDLTSAELETAGIPETLVRLSVGTEHPDDLVADVETAIAAAFDR